MKFFDANAMLGAHFAPYANKFPDPLELLAEMNFFGIEEALVYHGLAKEYNTEIGNKKLLKEIADFPRLHPCWVIAPHHTGEISAPAELITDMFKKGVKTGRLFFGGPLSYGELPDFLTYRELFVIFNQYQIPLIIEFEQSELLTWANIISLDTFLEHFPDVPFIVGAPKIGGNIDRVLYPRLEKYKNLYIELSGYQHAREIENMVKHFGSKRLIFGTRFPWYGIAQTMINLTYAHISEEDKNAIAGENFKGLLRKGKG